MAKVFNRPVKLAGEEKTIDSIDVRVLLTDKDNNVLLGSGLVVPTGAGYAKGGLFLKQSASSGAKAVYENQGTVTTASFSLVGATQVEKISLTNAEIKALRATPKTLVSAPGANKSLEFISAVLKLNYGGTNVFTESTDNLAVKYTNGAGVAVSQTIESGGFIDATADTQTNALAKIDAIVASSGAENQALVLHNTGDGEIGGNAGADNTIDLWVAYRVIDFS